MRKKDFTAADKGKYEGIIATKDAISTADTENIKGTNDTKDTGATNNANSTITTKSTGARKGRPLSVDPRDTAPDLYRFTVRLPGEYGRFLAELAYQRRSTITAEFERLVAEEMAKRPEILASLDELNQ